VTPPRPEYPRPHLVRARWRTLNGAWRFAEAPPPTDPGEVLAAPLFDRTIQVPFPPESPLSGIGDPGFHPSLWYRRDVDVPAEWDGARILLHVGAADYRASVFVDGVRVGEHVGGSAPFTVDLTPTVRAGGRHDLVIHVDDDLASGVQPAGKQSRRTHSYGCYYTRVSGLWQSVWLEAVHPAGLATLDVVPDLARGRAVLVPTYGTDASDLELHVTARSGERSTETSVPARSGIPVEVPLAEPRPWSPEDPFLHDLVLRVRTREGAILDEVGSYVGLRDVRVEGDRILLNGEPRYLRFVLDQGYWPDGIWTAPSDAALVRDIELARAAGFNGARLHQKAFEPRYHAHADRLGWLTWAEMPSWGIDENDPVAGRNLLHEWAELVVRDRSHPSIVGWTPLNETEDRTVGPEHRRLVRDAARLTRDLDPTRPVNDASGWVHQDTDLWTVHLYDQDPDALAARLRTDPPHRHRPDLERYDGQPIVLDEFGGTRWPPGDEAEDVAWGYGDAPTDESAFHDRLEGLVDAVLAAPRIRGYCYTQLTDVEQEVNGLYHADRTPKFSVDRLHATFSRDPGDTEPPAPPEPTHAAQET
jgi:beta-galactosidase/beta-glucuronidase